MFVQKASVKHNVFIVSVVNILILLSFISINQGNKYLFYLKCIFIKIVFISKIGTKQPESFDEFII